MNKGNSNKGMLALEMILFLPLAALLTFVAIDLALYATDYGLVSDALRSGLNSYKSYKGNIISINNKFSSAEVSCALLEHIERNTVKKFEQAKGISQKERANYILKTSALFLIIDPQTGNQVDQRIIDSSDCPSLSDGNLPPSSLLLDELNSDNFHHQLLIGLRTSTASQTTAPHYFNPYLLQVFSQIQTTSRSINPYLTALLVDRLYEIHSEEMLTLDSNWILTNQDS